MNPELADRLARIESTLAHLEHQFEQLNQVVIAQAQELARLKSAHQRVAQSLETAELERIRASQARPPHYQ